MQASFLCGVILGCAARHPAAVLQAGCAFLWTAVWAIVWAMWQVVNRSAATRNVAILLGFGVLTEVAIGGGVSLALVLFLAAKLSFWCR
ncbi:MAG: hypothetical protein WAW42_15175 [Candidatus Competibacteraceae bacterium]